ncbi:MAG: FAD-dependent oxidoreductase [Alphaproteobacteria bacterium]|nr:FAD-dependent oxidoreductase [Alphaproteobacteria bacterium]
MEPKESCWVATRPPTAEAKPLTSFGLRVDVAVIGGGLVGLTAALLLARAGRSVAVIESRRAGRQVTGGSTAKVTSQHGAVYRQLVEGFGESGARIYAESNQAALDWIAREVAERQLECDFERRAAYVWTEDPARVADLEREAETAFRLGLPASFERQAPLPWPVAGAVRFDAQAQFHPVRWTEALAADLVARGGALYEETRVIDVEEGKPCRVVTERGLLHADDVIVATNLPILDRGGFFGKAFPQRHMALAGPIDEAKAPEGMFIGLDQPTRSIRTAPLDGGGRMLVLVGEAFPTGHGDAAASERRLEEFARTRLGLTDIRWRWGNQDYYAADRVPYVGRILPGERRIRVATGFNAWGITTGTVAAMILADDILGRRNPWAPLYDSLRIKPGVGGRAMLGKNLHVARTWLEDRISRPATQAADLAAGQGGVVRHGGQTVAAWRDPQGALHLVSHVCTHMGCHLRWNAAELSWDCPCHGSRFDVDGRVVQGPAVRDLERKA